MPELLSICIPTFNREAYLRDLVEGLIDELGRIPQATQLVKLYVSDNASTDGTRDLVGQFFVRWPITYHRNSVNIGADGNFLQLIAAAQGTYFWLVGDDELVKPGFLDRVLAILKPELYHLVLLGAVDQDGGPCEFSNAGRPTAFADYHAFVEYFSKADPWKLIGHSLITTMVAKRAIFDLQMARSVLMTVDKNYAHMYGLVEGLSRHRGSIYYDTHPSIIVRNRRATVRDISGVEFNYLWKRYYRWLGNKFGHPELVVYGRKLFNWRRHWPRWLWIKCDRARLDCWRRIRGPV
jgi:glycosyltransferase involved in cell wall biosynthesis